MQSVSAPELEACGRIKWIIYVQLIFPFFISFLVTLITNYITIYKV